MSEPGRIPLSEPHLVGNVRKYVDECLDTNFVSSVGPFVPRFEEAFAAYVGARHAVACASGTAAIHVALRLLGAVDGEEVLVSTLTFIASANPILYERGRPILVDSEAETWNMDVGLVVEELDRRARQGERQPRAVEVVHIYGHPSRPLDALAEACERHGVALLEDASEALGARYTGGRFAGRHVGTIGRLGCFSFNGNKIITTGGGGMITTDDPELARRARHLTTQARIPGIEYRHDEVGYNYRLTNVAAALGLAQLESLPGFLERKKEIAARYDAAWASRPGITPPPRAAWAMPSFWLYSIAVDEAEAGCDRTRLLELLREAGIESRPLWSPLHGMAMYREAPRIGSGRVAETLFARGLSLPSSVGLTPDAQDRVIAAVLAATREAPVRSGRA